MTPLCVIVRHGNTFAPGEPPRRIGARTDLPLVASGREQALRLREHFAGRGWLFDRALASPLRRTRETAALILGDAGPAAPPCEWLAEVDHGPDEGLPEADVLARLGEQALAAWDREGTPPDGWVVDAETRRAGWQAFYAASPPPLTLLVTSNGAARFALLADARLAAEAAALPSLKLATGAYGVIALQEDGPHLLAWDRRP